MSAFELRVDPVAVLVGFGGTLVLAVAAVVPAAWRLARLPIAAALSED
ncbi:hypothetical protein Poly30_33400 [Planctomycetes bacterium Poly30]|nr:hypothetical protein Poly30_33400 [Planctomycetes bacterium Poly30]